MSLAYCFAKSPDTAMSTKSRFLFSLRKNSSTVFLQMEYEILFRHCVHWRKGAVLKEEIFRLWSTKIISCPTAPVHPTIPNRERHV